MNEQLEAIKTALEYIEKMKGGIKDSISAFQEGDNPRGLSFMPYIVEGLEWIIEVVTLTSDCHKEKIELESMLEKLKEMVEAFENGDYILVSDLLEYEIVPILQEWEKNLRMSVIM